MSQNSAIVNDDLQSASDEEIEDALLYADPMVLRGLLYQLTGDERIAETEVVPTTFGFLTAKALGDPADAERLRAWAAALLKQHRDPGAGEMPVGPTGRLRRSLGLTAGQDVPERDCELWLEELALDPWARGLTWPEEPSPERVADFQVMVIGAGMSGLNAAIQLKQAGIPYVVIEKNPGVGGTWFENRYPGARVDTPSRGYCHLYGVDFEYPYPFCPQSENERYMQWIADRFDVHEGIEFGTEALALEWDDAASLWEVRTAGPDGARTWRVNAVISAVGFLSRPSVPELPGAGDFQGEIFHTARWPADLDLSGKRVAVVGSGCTGYQLFPEVAKVAAHTSLFQRTPSWVYEAVGYLSPYPPQVNWLERNFPYYRNFMRFRGQWLFGPEVLGLAFKRDLEFNDGIRRQRLEFMGRKFADRPDLMEKMLPSTRPMTSRPVLVDDADSVYDALLRDDVTLVTDGIAQITETSIVDGTGVDHPVDAIVLATGFRVNEFLWPLEVRGRGGASLADLWQTDGARAYLMTMMPGFPNLFTLYGPNGNPVGGGGVPAAQEQQMRFVLQCLARVILSDSSAVDVSREGYDRFNRELDEAEAGTIYVGTGANNYYTTEHGRSAANCPFDERKMWEWLRDPSGDYARTASWISINADSEVRPYFGEDLRVD